MKLLLTGGIGYIGSHTAVVLVQAGFDVVLLDNCSNSKASFLERLNSIVGRPLTFVEGDVRDTTLVTQTLKSNQIDAVVHFAGLKAVGESVSQPLNYFANNVQGSISLLQAMQEANVHLMVFSSSATVYGQPQYLPIDEQHPTFATNPYGRTKLHIEEILKDQAASNDHWRFVCLRYFNPVGAHSSGLIGDDPQGIPNNLMPYITQVATGVRPALQVFGDDYETPDGTGVRDYIHVMDLARGHLAAIQHLKSHSGWHAFNLGTGKGYSVLELASAFERVSGIKIPINKVGRRAGDVASSFANVAKSHHELSWHAKFGLIEMCKDSWHWAQNNT